MRSFRERTSERVSGRSGASPARRASERGGEALRAVRGGGARPRARRPLPGQDLVRGAVQEGLRRLREGSVRKIILGRPAVTADEDLGFLPGSEKDKLLPLLAPRPLAVGPGDAVLLDVSVQLGDTVDSPPRYAFTGELVAQA